MEIINRYWTLIIIVFVISMFIKFELCFIILGSLVMFLCIHYYLAIKTINKSGIETKALILNYTRDHDGYKTPTLKFKTLDGTEIKKEPYYYASTDLSKFRSYSDKINETVSVKYDLNNPEKFIICDEKNFNWGTIVFAMIVGLIFLCVAFASILGYIKLS